MVLTDEVWLWTGVAGIQDVSDSILRHQILLKKQKPHRSRHQFYIAAYFLREKNARLNGKSELERLSFQPPLSLSVYDMIHNDGMPSQNTFASDLSA